MPPTPSAMSSDSAPVGMADRGVLVAHPHDRALAELALDLGERAVQGGVAGLRRLFLFLVHYRLLRSLEIDMEPERADGTDVRPLTSGK
jgi:hypothetical protein